MKQKEIFQSWLPGTTDAHQSGTRMNDAEHDSPECKGGNKMNATKLMVTLSCLLAILIMAAHTAGARGMHFENELVSMSAGAVTSPPFTVRIEALCALFAEKELVSKITDIPAGTRVLVTEKFSSMDQGNKMVTLRVKYLGYTGWVYGTLHVALPN
jgi:hypothetical protein